MTRKLAMLGLAIGFAVIGLILSVNLIAVAASVGTAFTYQGYLEDGGSAANGDYDFQFKLYDAATDGTQVGSTLTMTPTTVTDGLFTVELDFGSDAFTGDARWLEISVRQGAGDYTPISPRTALTPAPYALHAVDAWAITGNSGTTYGTNFLGTTDEVSLTLAVNGTAALRLEPHATSPNVIGGYSGNSVTAGVWAATIGGGGVSGYTNIVTTSYGTVGGGAGNTASGVAATVGGGDSNTASGTFATVGGGRRNTASGSHASTVGGGTRNTASDEFATVGGGYGNDASGYGATVGGGYSNEASEDYATVGGGKGNTASKWYATVGGGDTNTASGEDATVGGGQNNTASDDQATVGGGYGNTASGDYATVGGGESITASGYRATVSGGYYNDVSGDYGTIAGGGPSDPESNPSTTNNRVTDDYGTIGGGGNNRAGNGDGDTTNAKYATVGGGFENTAEYTATVGGGQSNTASGTLATVGGGQSNTASGQYATVPGGRDNVAGDSATTVGGGYSNTASGTFATVGGGYVNTASGDYATVGGGQSNTASDDNATVGGGFNNAASDAYATVGGGQTNTASANYATVPGGYYNVAGGFFSFAAGRQAKANKDGCFVWGDSYNGDVICNNNNRTIFRSSGGFYIYTKSDLSTGMYMAANGSSWNGVSDRERKENFVPVDTQELLARLAENPITTWNYKAQDPSIRHIGPMAQDFNALLEDLGGEGEKYINSLDADGVALAAIQGLYQLSQEQAARIEELEAENAALQGWLGDLEARLAALEAAAQVDKEARP